MTIISLHDYINFIIFLLAITQFIFDPFVTKNQPPEMF